MGSCQPRRCAGRWAAREDQPGWSSLFGLCRRHLHLPSATSEAQRRCKLCPPSGSCRAAAYAGRQHVAAAACSGGRARPRRSAVVSSLGPCPPPAWAAAAAKEDRTGSSQGPRPPWGGEPGSTIPGTPLPFMSGLQRETRVPEVPTFSINPAQCWAGVWQSGGRLGCLTNFNPILSHASTGLGCWQVEHKPLET